MKDTFWQTQKRNFIVIKSRITTNQVKLITFLVGFFAMLLEMYSLKIVFLYFAESSQTTALAISAFLAGLGFSSLVVSNFVLKYYKKEVVVLNVIICLSIIYCLFFLEKIHLIPEIIGGGNGQKEISRQFVYYMVIWTYLFIPAFLIGSAFPLLTGIFQQSYETRVKDFGLIYFIDLLGSIVGTLVTGFVLIPKLGMSMTLSLAGTIGGLIICIINIKGKPLIGSLPFLVLLAYASFRFVNTSNNTEIHEPASELNNTYEEYQTDTLISSIDAEVKDTFNSMVDSSSKKLTEEKKTTKGKSQISPDFLKDYDRFGEVLFQKPSNYGIITAGKTKPEDLSLFINYRDMCSTSLGSAKSLGSITARNLSGNSKVLNIGLGCGLTAAEIVKSKNVESLTIVEINPVIVEVCDSIFSSSNDSVLYDSKLNLLVENGINYIDRSKGKIYDAIVIDVEEPGIIRSSAFYTVEYVGKIKKMLKDRGIFSLWAIHGTHKYNEILYHTLLTQFKYVSFNDDMGNVQLYASDRELNLRDRARKEWKDKPRSKWEINTLDNRILENSYSIEETFGFPPNVE